MNNRIKWFVRIGAVALISFLIFCVGMIISGPSRSDYLRQIKALRADSIQYRNQYNELVAEKLAFEGTVKDLKDEVKYWKQTGDTLRTQLTSKTRTVILLEKKLKISGTGVVQPPKDSVVYIHDTVIDTPTIAIDTADAWHRLRFASDGNKYAYELEVADATELVTEKDKNGTLVRVVNRNPYVVNSGIRSVVVAEKKPKRGVWLAIGVAIGFILK